MREIDGWSCCAERTTKTTYLALVRAFDEAGDIDNVEVGRYGRGGLEGLHQKVKALVGHGHASFVGVCR